MDEGTTLAPVIQEEWSAAQLTLLEAGARVLATGISIGDLRMVDVIQEAGKTTGSFYHAWPEGIAAFRTALLTHVLGGRLADFWATTAAAPLDPSTATLADLIRELGRANAEAMDDQHGFRSYISLWLRHGDDDVRAALGDHYRSWTEGAFVPLYDATYDAYGLVPRSPLTTTHLAIALTALAEGLALRRAVDPESLLLPDELAEQGWDFFGLVAYLIAGATAHPATDPDDRSATELGSDLLAGRVPERSSAELEAAIQELSAAAQKVRRLL